MIYISEYCRHFAKTILGRNDNRYGFFKFERRINPKTKRIRSDILKWSEKVLLEKETYENESSFLESDNPVVVQGYKLRNECLNRFKEKCIGEKGLRILMHIPLINQSMAGYSLFNNLTDGLEYIGIDVRRYCTGDNLNRVLTEFRPTIFLTSDNDPYILSVDWESIKKYSSENILRIGFTASLEEYGNTPLRDRLKRARGLGVDFFYSFKAIEYIETNPAYIPFYDFGREVISIEFGANPLSYYPVPLIEADLNYVLLASANNAKKRRYIEYLSKVLSNYTGFFDGPGWSHTQDFTYNKNRDRYIYTRAKAGLNLHIDNQISVPCELNERTYILAMCGVPQIIDNPPLLKSRFNLEGMFIAALPDEYYSLFEYALHNQDESRKKALIAQKEVFAKHTSFHRAERFIADLKKVLI